MNPNQIHILNLCRDILDGKEIECEHVAIERFISLLRREYKDDISLTYVAGFCWYSVSHLTDLIKIHLDSSYLQVLSTLRLEAARRLLISSNDKITDICYDSGYTDLTNFGDKFKRLFGESPSSYRKNHKKDEIKMGNKHNFKNVEYGFNSINGVEMVGTSCCISEHGCSIASASHGNMGGSDDRMHEQRRANARRIAACINYCKNISTEELES